MLSSFYASLLYAVGYRFFFGLFVLCLSSVCLGIHFYLGNSFSVIQDWFEFYLVELLAISTVIMFFLRNYLTPSNQKGRKVTAVNKRDSLLLVNYFIIFFFILINQNPDFSYDSLRYSLFLTIFVTFDFLNSDSGFREKILSFRLRLTFYATHLILSYFSFYIFFGTSYKFSYLFLLFLLGFFCSNEILNWNGTRLVKFYAPIVFFFNLSLGGNIFFPVESTTIIFFALLFFGFNLVTFQWHKVFFRNF